MEQFSSTSETLISRSPGGTCCSMSIGSAHWTVVIYILYGVDEMLLFYNKRTRGRKIAEASLTNLQALMTHNCLNLSAQMATDKCEEGSFHSAPTPKAVHLLGCLLRILRMRPRTARSTVGVGNQRQLLGKVSGPSDFTDEHSIGPWAILHLAHLLELLVDQ